MPKVGGPGNDNVSGDRYTLDLGVEPDLGNLLQNLKVTNDLLDEAEQRFQAIGDIIGSTTQRLAQATRQTELLAAQTQRLQNSYQSIASAGMTLAQIGAGGMMPGMGGMMGGMGMMPQYGAPQYPNLSMTQPSQMLIPGGGGEEVPRFAPPPAARTHLPGSVRLAAWEQIAQHTRLTKGGGPISTAIGKFKAGYGERGWSAGRAAQMGEGGGNVLTTGGGFGRLAGIGESGEALAGGGEAAGLLGGLGGAAAYAIPVGIAAAALYKLGASQIASSRRYTGMTGGTGVFGGVGGGSAMLGARSTIMNLLNPGVDYGKLQEETLQAGYTDQNKGGMYGTARDYLFQAAKRGMGDIVDQVDLFQEVVEKSGGSVTDLTNAMDVMQGVAKNTNASLTIMAQNYKMNVETLTGMGMGGTGASAAAAIQATAWAGSVNPALRAYAGPDLGASLFLQAGVAQMNGVGFTQMPGYLAGAIPGGGNVPPGMQGMAIPGQTEQVVKNFLQGMGFRIGQNQAAIMANPQFYAAMQVLGPAPSGIGALSAADASDANTVAAYIESIMGKGGTPAQQKEAAILKSAQGTTVKSALTAMAPKFGGYRGGAGVVSQALASGDTGQMASTYVQQLGIGALTGPGGVSTNPVSDWYTKWLAKGGKIIPALDSIAKGKDVYNAYVQTADGEVHPLWQWIQANGDRAGQMLADGSAQIATATEAEKSKMSYDTKTGTMSAKPGSGAWQASDLKFVSAYEFVDQKAAKPPQGDVVRFAPDQWNQMQKWWS